MTKLDRTWKNCLRMWKWVSENLPKGFASNIGRIRRDIVYSLKVQWMKDHRYGEMSNHCFFCGYKDTEYHFGECGSCPGSLANAKLKEFWCQGRGRDWGLNPKAFYRKLVELDKKRKAK